MARRCSTQADKVLRPCILWNDARSFAECEEIEAREPKAAPIAGNIPLAGFTAPKLVWVKKHEPRHLRQGGQGPAAQGLCPLPHDRRLCLRHVGFLRHLLARHRQARMVGRCCSPPATCGATRCRSSMRAPMPRAASRQPSPRPGACRSGRWWPAAAATMRRPPAASARSPRLRLRLARHVGRALRLQRQVPPQYRPRGACLLPCRAGHLAPDGRHPLGRRQPRMAGRHPRHRRRRS